MIVNNMVIFGFITVSHREGSKSLTRDREGTHTCCMTLLLKQNFTMDIAKLQHACLSALLVICAFMQPGESVP